MSVITVAVSEDGNLVCLNQDATECFSSIGRVTTRRASNVEPESVPLRLVFRILRWLFGDKGWMASFTRYWPCLWRVNIAPIGGPILPGRWKNRQEAIDAEVAWINEHLE